MTLKIKFILEEGGADWPWEPVALTSDVIYYNYFVHVIPCLPFFLLSAMAQTGSCASLFRVFADIVLP